MKTSQQNFWEGEFGESYIARNSSKELLASNLAFFSQIFSHLSQQPSSIIEFGANIGMNGSALNLLFPNAQYFGVEINELAFQELEKIADKAFLSSIEDFKVNDLCEISFTKGVLIHLNPDSLNNAYQKLYESTSRYILIAEYFNPHPVGVNYRGHEDKLFKRDFAREIMNQYKDLSLIANGFSYSSGVFPQDNINWFLMEKRIHD